MKNKVVIYINDKQGVSIFTPSAEAIEKWDISTIAKAAVPHNKKFGIFEIEDIFPTDGYNEDGTPNVDRSFRNAWEIDENLLTEGVGSIFNTIEEILND